MEWWCGGGFMRKSKSVYSISCARTHARTQETEKKKETYRLMAVWKETGMFGGETVHKAKREMNIETREKGER